MGFHKLVRDQIPEIIKNQGEKALIRVLEDDEYQQELKRKLIEEVNEFQESEDIEELADIMEVVYALCEAKGATKEQLEEVRLTKYQQRGGFSRKYFLIGKE